MMGGIFSIELIAAMLRVSTPITLAALGGLLCQKAGVFNIALEGMILVGAFFGIVGAYVSKGSIIIGYLLAIACTTLVALLYGLISIKLKANIILAGLGVNLFALGLTSFMLNAMFNMAGSLRPMNMSRFPRIQLPLVNKIPYIGNVISGHDLIVYVAIFFVVIISFVLRRMRIGLSIASVGENSDTARTAGISPDQIKLLVILLSGFFCGIAGAHLSCDMVSEFSEDMVQGRGFTAFTAVVFGSANPVLTWFASLLFGFAASLGTRIEIAAIGIPASLVNIVPYALCIIALTISVTVARKNAQRLFAKEHSISKAVVFDMDGVLCKSEAAFITAITSVLREYGISPLPKDFRAASGASDNEFIGKVCEKYGIEYDPVMKEKAYRRYGEIAPRLVKGFFGVPRMIRKLKTKGYKIAIVSSADFQKVLISLEAIGIPKEIFDVIVSANDVERAKPAPDLFLRAAELLGMMPSDCIALDDSPLGIRGANDAGMHTIAILTDRTPKEFKQAEPDYLRSKTSRCLKTILKI